MQKRLFPVRKEAADLLRKLITNTKNLPDDLKAMNSNNQNLTKNTLGTLFNEGNREDNVTKNLVKDRDKMMLQRLEKEKGRVMVDTTTEAEKKQKALIEKYGVSDQTDVQHTFRISNLNIEGNPADPNDFLDGKSAFDEFLEIIKETVANKSKVKLRFHYNFRKNMHTDIFTGVVNFYFDDKSQAELLKKELEGSVFNNYELSTEWFERKPPQARS